LLQESIFYVRALLPKSITLMQKVSYKYFTFPAVSIQLGILPMVCAIGFVTGHVIALPLAVGALSHVFCLGPLQTLFFSYLAFSLYVQFYLVLCALITTYQISAIEGRIGLALLVRFATFVMVPAMLLFNLDNVQLVFIATFIEISGGVATDVLFGRKLAQ